MNNEPNILIVDNEAGLRHFMQTALQKEGFSKIYENGYVA